MRFASALLLLACFAPVRASEPKLSDDERVEILRGLDAEYAKAKVIIPRSARGLPVETDGKYDPAKWAEMGKGQSGPCARVGDMVQITHIHFEDDKIILEINGGQKKNWKQHIQLGVGGQAGGMSNNTNSATGTNIALDFHKPLPPLASEDIKKMLTPILDFQKDSPTENFIDTLPPEQQKAVKENRVIVGMSKDAVLLALGRPRLKSRETDADGLETEDWVYGDAPGKITFVTFANSKVIRVKEEFADLGGSTAPPTPGPVR